MAARKNGPLSGPSLGIDWHAMRKGQKLLYPGTPNGARTNTFRANQVHAPLRFRSFKSEGKIFIERVK